MYHITYKKIGIFTLNCRFDSKIKRNYDAGYQQHKDKPDKNFTFVA